MHSRERELTDVVMSVARLIRRRQVAALEPFGLSPSQSRALRVLTEWASRFDSGFLPSDCASFRGRRPTSWIPSKRPDGCAALPIRTIGELYYSSSPTPALPSLPTSRKLNDANPRMCSTTSTNRSEQLSPNFSSEWTRGTTRGPPATARNLRSESSRSDGVDCVLDILRRRRLALTLDLRDATSKVRAYRSRP